MKIIKGKNNLTKFKFEQSFKTPSFSIYEYEIYIIEQVYMHRYIRSADLIQLFNLYRKLLGLNEITRAGISRRLMKLCEYGVLKLRQNKEMKNNGFNFNSFFYTLGSRGLEVLVEMQRITEVHSKRFIAVMNRLSLPSYHTMAASTLANNIVMHLLETERISAHEPSLYVMRGNQHSLLGTVADVPVEIKGLVVPDYLIDMKNTIIALEVDSGRQGKDVILNKINRYNEFMKTDYAKNKKIYVVFAPIDYSVAKYYESSTRFVRTSFLKSIFTNQEEWSDRLHVYSSPSVYVPELVARVFDDFEHLDSMYQTFLVEEWAEYAMILLKNLGFETGQFDEMEILNYAVEPLIKADYCLTIKHPNKKSRYYFVLRMNPGSIRSYERYQVYLSRCHHNNESDLSSVTLGLILLYDDESCLQSELLDIDKNKNVDVLLTERQSWVDSVVNHRAKSKNFTLPFWKFGTKYSKVPYEMEELS